MVSSWKSSTSSRLQSLQEALDQLFPEVEKQVDTQDYQNVLRVTVIKGDRRWALCSPEGQDWRQHDDKWWIHRISTQLRKLP